MNSEEIKEMWGKCMQREAVHLLMLQKVNVNIQALKEDMVEIFVKDEIFEKQLFEVSSQGRDIKNQVTFKLKDSYYDWFDPFMYISPDAHSQIFRMYQQNSLTDKMVDRGLNDIVGDYDSHYKFLTPLNDQLMANLARSKIIDLVVPLLLCWLTHSGSADDQLEEEEDNQKTMGEAERQMMEYQRIFSTLVD
jgi:hypothetical protein